MKNVKGKIDKFSWVDHIEWKQTKEPPKPTLKELAVDIAVSFEGHILEMDIDDEEIRLVSEKAEKIERMVRSLYKTNRDGVNLSIKEKS